MAVEVELEGNGSWAGGSAGLISYTVDEEATPLVAGDSAGAISNVRFSVASDDDTPLLYETPIVLKDGSNGTIRATINSLSMTQHTADISADSILSPLVPERRIVPRTGTLAAVISAVMADSGITSPILFDASLNATTTTVSMQGWYGSAWEWLKQLCQAFQFEVSVVDNNILIRAPRTRTTNVETDSERRLNIDRGEVAKHIEIIRYENTYRADAIVYPAGGWTDTLETYSVEASEVIEVEIPIDVSLVSIEQPTCVTFVPKTYNGASVYAISGNDGLPIPPAQWNATGGKVEVSIGEDTKTINLKITGSNLTQYSPYTLSINSGASEAYSSLRLRGTGVHFTKSTLKYPTGADPQWATQDVGITIDNPTIQTMGQVATLALSAARAYSAPSRTMSATALVVNRPGEAGFIRYLTFGDFDEARGDTYTFQSFKTEFAGKTFGTIRSDLRAASSATDKYENQAFGNVVGSMVRLGDSNYRIRRATISESQVNYEAEADNTFADIKAATAGMTFAQLKTLRTGMLYSEVSLTPLRNT